MTAPPVGWFRSRFPDLQPDETIELRAIPTQWAGTGERVRVFCASPQAAAEAAAGINPALEIYYGVNPRRGHVGTKEGVSRVTCLWADVDDKHFDSPEAARAALDAFELSPSLVVASGGGLQAYWTLREPLAPANFAYAENLVRRLAYRLGHLDSVHDVSRLLRVPGTANHKYPGEARPVTLVRESAVAYAPQDFDAVLPPLPEERHAAEARTWGDAAPPEDEIRAMLVHIDPHLPYAEWLACCMAVHSAYPDERGERLVRDWSDCRAGHDQQRMTGAKWRSFRRQAGQRATLGTLVHHARAGGYEPPRVAEPALILGGRARRRSVAEAAWRTRLADLPEPPADDLPHLLTATHDWLQGAAVAFPRDWVTLGALTAYSALFPAVRFESMHLNLWFLGIAPSGAGKNAVTDRLFDAVRAAAPDLTLYTHGTPEGMYRKLAGEGQRMYAYFAEYAGFLDSLKREHMAGAKEVLMNLHDGRAAAYHRSRDSLEMLAPFLVTVATTTPRAWAEHASPADLASGYLSRFWCCAPDTVDRVVDDPPPPEATAVLAGRLREHAAAHAHLRHATWDCRAGEEPPAYAAYRARLGVGTGRVTTFEDALVSEELAVGRFLARVKKVAALLEILDAAPQTRGALVLVRDRYAALAVTLVERARCYADRAAAALVASEDERTLARLERALAKGPLTFRELLQQTHAKRQDLRPLLALLVEEGRVREAEAGRTYRYELAA